MIDKVLVLGIRRAGELIPDSDIAQMVGRCGRSYTESGEATVIVPSRDEENAERYLFSKPKAIRSSLTKVEDVAFHFLPEIRNNVFLEDIFNQWYSRSLASMQGMKIDWNEVLEYLLENECIFKINGRYIISDLGNVSCNYYLKPSQVFQMKTRLNELNNFNSLDSTSLGWILSFDKIYKNMEEDFSFQEFISDVKGRHMFFEKNEDIDAYAWFCVFSAKNPKIIRSEIANHRKDVQRMINALKSISHILDFKIDEELETYEICGIQKIPVELAIISKNFPDAKKTILLELESFSIHNLNEMKDKMYELRRYSSEELKKYAESKFTKIE